VPPARLAEFRGYLEQVSSETSRAGRIVTDLLAFSRRSTPRRGLEDLNALVKKTVALVDHKLKMLNVEVVCDLDMSLPQVPCDASQIQQVILNLVLNASEAITDHGTVVVTTRVARPQESVTLTVRDSGAGIPPDVLPRIFDPFFTTKEEGKGVGLGLAVVYGIIQSHGGDLEVTSAPGKGTEFCVHLPLTMPVREGGEAATPAGDAPVARVRVAE
jgi:two-component system, NtrC family, sensor kinase